MSRVVYENTPATAGQESLRAAHGVRLVTREEEGAGVNALPNGVYGYTYSPGLPNSPLFATRRYHSYEVHKLPSGDAVLTGFVSAGTAAEMASATADITIRVSPEPHPGADTLVLVPYARMRQHRQYAAPNQDGFTVTLAPLVR